MYTYIYICIFPSDYFFFSCSCSRRAGAVVHALAGGSEDRHLRRMMMMMMNDDNDHDDDHSNCCKSVGATSCIGECGRATQTAPRGRGRALPPPRPFRIPISNSKFDLDLRRSRPLAPRRGGSELRPHGRERRRFDLFATSPYE